MRTDWVRRVIDVVKSTAVKISQDRILAVAGGITFFVLLAMFPALGALVSLYGMFADRVSITHLIDIFAPFLPGGAITVLNAELHRLAAEKPAKLNLGFFIGMVIALWSASGGISALVDGLNIACETREGRSFLRLTANALLFTAASILFAMALSYLILFHPAVSAHVWVRHEFAVVSPVLKWPMSFLFCLGLTGIIYRFGPDLGATRRLWISWGSVAASIFWLAATLLFAWYARNYGSYDRVYGSLGAIVGFLTWIWLLLVILLSGAELNCEIDRRRRGHSR